MTRELKVQFVRNAKVVTYPFQDYFKNFENVEAVRRIFGSETEEVLRTLRVEFTSGRGYMGVSDEDGHLRVSANYLNNGDPVDLYLDIIHELTHVRQFREGKRLFDNHYRYVDRPTELEAFQNAVDEARRLGLNDMQITEYLRTERMTDDELNALTKALGVKAVEQTASEASTE
ncbi:MAG: hypothetical protein QXF26_04820 [Candidatus Bathyarchaeia archaeon]